MSHKSTFPKGSMAYENEISGKSQRTPTSSNSDPAYPFPPKSSMYWQSPGQCPLGNSYDEAVANYQKSLSSNLPGESPANNDSTNASDSSPTPETVLTTSKEGNSEAQQIQENIYPDTDEFQLDDIPGAMRNMGWEIAPLLMEHWFSQPQNILTAQKKDTYIKGDSREIPKAMINDTIVKMAWAVQYTQTKDGIDELINQWNNEAGLRILKRRLASKGWLYSDKEKRHVRIGDEDDAVTLEATAQINRRPVGSNTDVINDWYGAIGNANLKVAVKGRTDEYNNRPVFIAEKLGFYITDTYDFADSNDLISFGGTIPLGIWSKERVLGKEDSVNFFMMTEKYRAKYYPGSVPVYNRDYREWQRIHGKGGDFFVFSDVLWISPPSSKKVTYLS